jgi:hypothetical protein
MDVAIGLSRNWDAKKAGQEVAKTAIQNLKTPPSFFLLFSTIHYKKYGGFQELLDGVFDILPPETPLIGGTISGFINNNGVFSRGATALAVSYPNIDIAIGIGKNSRLHPKKAATTCSKMIKKKLNKSKYNNKILINVISGPIVPFGIKINVLKSNLLGWLIAHIGYKIFTILGTGIGKEEDIIEKIVAELPNYNIIGGTSVDSWAMTENYQFINSEVHKNSIVAIGCSIDRPIFLKSSIGLHKTKKKFLIDKTITNNRIIKKINGKPAKQQFLKQIGIIEDQFKDLGAFYYRTANYFPISFEENEKYTTGVAGFFGDSIALGHKSRGRKARLLSITGKEILKEIESCFIHPSKCDFPFVLMYSSSIFLNSLGSKSQYMKKTLDNYLNNIPYLMVCPATENGGTPDNPAVARVYSFNAMAVK